MAKTIKVLNQLGGQQVRALLRRGRERAAQRAPWHVPRRRERDVAQPLRVGKQHGGLPRCCGTRGEGVHHAIVRADTQCSEPEREGKRKNKWRGRGGSPLPRRNRREARGPVPVPAALTVCFPRQRRRVYALALVQRGLQTSLYLEQGGAHAQQNVLLHLGGGGVSAA